MQVAHLRAACGDANETTVIVTVDETCEFERLPQRYPSICASYVMRVYPFNSERSETGFVCVARGFLFAYLVFQVVIGYLLVRVPSLKSGVATTANEHGRWLRSVDRSVDRTNTVIIGVLARIQVFAHIGVLAEGCG